VAAGNLDLVKKMIGRVPEIFLSLLKAQRTNFNDLEFCLRTFLAATPNDYVIEIIKYISPRGKQYISDLDQHQLFDSMLKLKCFFLINTDTVIHLSFCLKNKYVCYIHICKVQTALKVIWISSSI
jgi:hypothetical protein